MRSAKTLGFLLLFGVNICLAQSLGDLTGQNSLANCADPSQAGTPECAATMSQRNASPQARDAALPTVRTPQLRTPPGLSSDQQTLNPEISAPGPRTPYVIPKPQTEFEQMVADSAGQVLPLFGQSFFAQPPSTFAPVNLQQVPSDYTIGPGDELQIRIWGQIDGDLRVTVDRAGQVDIPQVGQVSVAGLHYSELEQHLRAEVSKVFKNFNLTVNLGRLHSIQVLVVGNAKFPGTYTIGALSTLVNAVFASGGPSPQGSLRHIQVRREGATITDFDFYDLLVKGDKSKDIRLQPGDVLYIPPVGPLVAISGSVNTPAIYEIKSDSTLNDLIEIAGNLSGVADTSKLTVERFTAQQSRTTMEFPYDDQSRALALKNGDIVRVFSIVPRFQDVVTLRGNVANPGRFPWKPGMRVRDLIPNADALLTRRYWLDRSDIVNGRATQYPLTHGDARTESRVSASKANEPGARSGQLEQGPDSTDRTGFPNVPDEQNGSSARSLSNRQRLEWNGANPSTVKNVAEDLRRYAPEINWDYAIIQRVDPKDLSSKLLWMSPRKAILEHDEDSNIELEAGDIVTIFSQRDISVPQTNRSQYVIVEGEVLRPGVYKLENNETLHSVLKRAGGLTPNAYVYGSELIRESARVEQQASLEELARAMEVQIRQSATALATSGSVDAQQLGQLQAQQEAVIAQLHRAKASGRVALPVRPKDRSLTDMPDMAMEDSDRLTIPHMPSTVSVVGNVYNAGSFIFDPHNTAGTYLELAGKGKPSSDMKHAFVLRANGVVVAANNVNGFFSGAKFERLRMYPGDQIIVPYKIPTGSFQRGLRDFTQISSQLAITAAGLSAVLR
jgi:polysaccharide biosynthesis/export protein